MALGSKLIERYVEAVKLNQGVKSAYAAWFGQGAATTAGGNLSGGVQVGAAGIGIYSGSGAPTIAAAKGSLYLRTDGSTTNDRAYINTNGSTTWTALTTAA